MHESPAASLRSSHFAIPAFALLPMEELNYKVNIEIVNVMYVLEDVLKAIEAKSQLADYPSTMAKPAFGHFANSVA